LALAALFDRSASPPAAASAAWPTATLSETAVSSPRLTSPVDESLPPWDLESLRRNEASAHSRGQNNWNGIKVSGALSILRLMLESWEKACVDMKSCKGELNQLFLKATIQELPWIKELSDWGSRVQAVERFSAHIVCATWGSLIEKALKEHDKVSMRWAERLFGTSFGGYWDHKAVLRAFTTACLWVIWGPEAGDDITLKDLLREKNLDLTRLFALVGTGYVDVGSPMLGTAGRSPRLELSEIIVRASSHLGSLKELQSSRSLGTARSAAEKAERMLSDGGPRDLVEEMMAEGLAKVKRWECDSVSKALEGAMAARQPVLLHGSILQVLRVGTPLDGTASTFLQAAEHLYFELESENQMAPDCGTIWEFSSASSPPGTEGWMAFSSLSNKALENMFYECVADLSDARVQVTEGVSRYEAHLGRMELLNLLSEDRYILRRRDATWPSHWREASSPTGLVDVTSEYAHKVEAMLRDTSGGANPLRRRLTNGLGGLDQYGGDDGPRLLVEQVLQVQSSVLWEEYSSKLAFLRRRHRQHSLNVAPLEPQAAEALQTLFHADVAMNETFAFQSATTASAEHIARYGFVDDVSSGVYGTGVYFTPCADRALEHCEEEGDGYFTLLINRVLLGDAFYVENARAAQALASQRRPPERLGRHREGLLYDSVVARPHAATTAPQRGFLNVLGKSSSRSWPSLGRNPTATPALADAGDAIGKPNGVYAIADEQEGPPVEYVLYDMERAYPELIVRLRVLQPVANGSSNQASLSRGVWPVT